MNLSDLARRPSPEKQELFSKMRLGKNSKRNYLSQSYYCREKWHERFQDPFIKDIKPESIKQKKISAVDTDIFVHGLTQTKALEMSEEMEELIRLLRRSPETINTLPSTSHTFIRILLDTKQYDLLFKTLSDPLNYGVFLDFHVADILMDTFIKESNFTAASRIASMLMLQEDFGPPLTRSLVLLSCFKYAFNENENEPWTDYHKIEEPEEEVKIIVKYIRNAFFDDHFDLREPLHIIGKTLAWLAPHLKEEGEIVLKSNSEILGWSLYEKWNSLETALLILLENKDKLDERIASKIRDSVSKCQDSEVMSRLDNTLIKIRDHNLITNLSIYEKIEENCLNFVNKYEEENVKSQSIPVRKRSSCSTDLVNCRVALYLKKKEKKNYISTDPIEDFPFCDFCHVNMKEYVYEEWAAKRKKAVEEQLEMFERARLLKEIKEKKEDLERREDVIFFFDNKDKWELLAPKRRYYPKKWSLIYGKKKPRVVDTEYVPPEI
ncbi:28S ribosomal protein S27, mitochondrial [Armadillidium nasatum]|uniref:28S ribosomal protein S27, mitochondrial n=1 Tax=Armadillidium nasatum TaxID=96803 RepID=A0A5N5THT0_9CRUS|nr:28S ribosomal protein S27, mitochondrial [Armadillidium nasatum]